MAEKTIALSDITAARQRIRGGVIITPCTESIPLSEITGTRIVCKFDKLQRTGSFKERGARNALLLLSAEGRLRGVVAASAGNHALGLAYHGRLLGIPVTVVMPEFAPLIKITTCQRLGARVVLHGGDFAEARAEANRLVEKEGATYVHGFDDPDIISGQGTLGLEILDQVPDVDAIICPVGGGGLLAGICVAVKARMRKVEVIAVESVATGNLSAALKAGRPVRVPRRATLADGLATLTVGENAFGLIRGRVDRVASVEEKWISVAILRMLELEKMVVEGAAATPLAAMLAGRIASCGDAGRQNQGPEGKTRRAGCRRRQHRSRHPGPGNREGSCPRRTTHALHGQGKQIGRASLSAEATSIPSSWAG